MSDTLSAMQAQEPIAFPESLTDAYKPRHIGEFVGLAKHKTMLEKLAASPRPCALLFVGASGTGKTSLAFAFARAIQAEVHHVSSQTCNLEALQEIVNMCHRVAYDFETGTPRQWHCVIVDEGDGMSSAAQKFLLSRLDGSNPCPFTIWIFTCNAVEAFEDRFLSRLIQFPKFNGYGNGSDIRDLLTRIWTERAPDSPMPDFSNVPTSNIRDALNWMECALLSV